MRRLCLLLALMGLLAHGLLARSARGEDVFTIAVLPDVQQETSGPRFKDRLTWLVNNRAALNLKMMLQCGDMMNFNDPAQYQHQSDGLIVLDNAKFPYATCIGNHDTAAVKVDGGSAAPGNVNTNLRNTTRYNTYFPTTRYQLLSGTYEANKIDNAYHIFTAGGLNWLVINLELWARTGAVDWAKTIVAKYPNHNVIFLTHAHLNGDRTIQQDNGGYGNNSPQYVFNQTMKPYANVRLVFSGHVGSHGYRTDTGTNGNTIYQFLQCYHDNTNNPTRLLQIDTKNGILKTWVYSPSNGETKNDGSSRTVTGVKWVQPAAPPPPPPPPAPPAAPTGLKATPVSASQINLTWTDNSSNETGFKVEGKTGANGTWSQIAVLGASVTSFASGSLKSSTTYYYRVRATNAAGGSAYSNEASATTWNLPPTVSLTSPAHGAVFVAPATITLNATASDPDGAIARVEFFSGATRLGEDATSAYSFTWSNVAAGAYTLTAKATDNGGATAASNTVNITVKPPAVVGNGNGLLGEYFAAPFLGVPRFCRADAKVDFDWGTGSPDPSLAADRFSVQWSGQVQAQYSETYTFTTTSDDGVRLWVNDVLLIGNWTDHVPTENSGTIALVAGQKYDLWMQYYENGGGAVAKLSWSSPSTPQQVVPQSQLYSAPLRAPENPANVLSGLDYAYYTGDWNALPDFNALTPVKKGVVSNFDLGQRTQNDYFAFRFTGFLDVPANGMYTFYTSSDDGSRLYLGGTLVVDNDFLHGMQEQAASIGLKAGKHALTVTFFERTGAEGLAVSWEGPGIAKQGIPVGRLYRAAPANGDGLLATYFDNQDLTGKTFSRVDATINFDWSTNAPIAGIAPDTYSVRWAGYIVPPASGTYTFTARTDDGVRLWINGQLSIDYWQLRSVAESSGVITLNGGQRYSIKMEYYNGPVYGVAQLYWAGPNLARQIVPQKVLYSK